MNETEKNITQFLNSELARRIKLNPRYSLRAFAQFLEISPATLSLVLNQKHAPSKKLQKKLEAKTLEDSNFKKRYLRSVPLVTSHYTSSSEEIDLETFAKISSWLSYAILSLFETRSFQSKPTWIAKRLGVSVFEVNDALNALSKAQMISMANSKWKLLASDIRINNKLSTGVTKAFQRELIEKSLAALDTVELSARDTSSMTLTFASERIDEAKAYIRNFRINFAKTFEEAGVSDEVYNLTIQLTPVTKEIKQ